MKRDARQEVRPARKRRMKRHDDHIADSGPRNLGASLSGTPPARSGRPRLELRRGKPPASLFSGTEGPIPRAADEGQRHHGFNESVDAPARLLDREYVDIEGARPGERGDSVEAVALPGRSLPGFEES